MIEQRSKRRASAKFELLALCTAQFGRLGRAFHLLKGVGVATGVAAGVVGGVAAGLLHRKAKACI